MIIIFDQEIIYIKLAINSNLNARNIDKNEYCSIVKSRELPRRLSSVFLNNFIWRYGQKWSTN